MRGWDAPIRGLGWIDLVWEGLNDEVGDEQEEEEVEINGVDASDEWR